MNKLYRERERHPSQKSNLVFVYASPNYKSRSNSVFVDHVTQIQVKV